MKRYICLLMFLSTLYLYNCSGERELEGNIIDTGVTAQDVILLEDVEEKKCDFSIDPIAYERPGKTQEGILLIDGRMLTPAGKNIVINTFPMNVVEVPDKKWIIVSNSGRTIEGSNFLQVIDYETKEVVYNYKLDNKFGNFLGLTLSKDNRTLYISGGVDDNVQILRIQEDGKIEKEKSVGISGFIGHIVVNLREDKIYAAQHVAGKVGIIENLNELKVIKSIKVGIGSEELPYSYPFWLTLSRDEKKLYVSNWGDRTVSVIDTTTEALVKNIGVGKNPEGVVLSPDGKYIYVSNSDTDDISIIDTADDEVVGTIKIYEETLLYGSSPTTMDISKDGRYLFVASAGSNSVDIVDTDQKKVIGRVPVGFYPVRVLLSSDGKRLFVANAKGNGSSPNVNGEDADEILFGSISILEIEDIFANLTKYSEQVIKNNSRPLRYYNFPCSNINSPVPIDKKFQSPIKHIIFIVKENKTFDQVLGDMENIEVDPSLVRFGEIFTPNTHKLAREFTVMDNCFSESEVSVQGHMWLTSATTNDYIERNWLVGDENRLFLPGIEPASYPASDFFFHHLMRNKVSFIVYGEAVGTMTDLEGLYGRKPRFEKYVDRNWPGGVIWNMSPKDEDRAKYFKDRLAEWEKEPEKMPSFIFMLLPNDHTYGVTPGSPAPDSMVSDNDYGLGLVVEYLSNSIFWKDSVIFVVEDDPQSGADHIDSHRTICLAIGPYVKRGYVSSLHYSFPSFHKTFELILGIDSLYQTDMRAAPILDVFTNTPDFTPYTALPRNIEDKIIEGFQNLDPGLKPLAEKSMLMDFSEPDSPKNIEMYEVLTGYMKTLYPHLFYHNEGK